MSFCFLSGLVYIHGLVLSRTLHLPKLYLDPSNTSEHVIILTWAAI